MKCPFCFQFETKVIDSRDTSDMQIRRRRECLTCNKRFTTYEKIETSPLIIIKRNGTKESYSREKILSGVQKSCNKRPITIEIVESLIDDIESEIRSKGLQEVPSSLIGELVIEKLKEIDKVAYLRFASVYKDFKDIKSFEKELTKLKIKEIA